MKCTLWYWTIPLCLPCVFPFPVFPVLHSLSLSLFVWFLALLASGSTLLSAISSSPFPSLFICLSSIHHTAVYLPRLFAPSSSSDWAIPVESWLLMLRAFSRDHSYNVVLSTVVSLTSTPGPSFACLLACQLSNPLLPASFLKPLLFSLTHLSPDPEPD